MFTGCSIAASGGTSNFHLTAYSLEGLGDFCTTEAEAVCRHCLQILTAATIKIWQFCTIHLLILDQYVSLCAALATTDSHMIHILQGIDLYLVPHYRPAKELSAKSCHCLLSNHRLAWFTRVSQLPLFFYVLHPACPWTTRKSATVWLVTYELVCHQPSFYSVHNTTVALSPHITIFLALKVQL